MKKGVKITLWVFGILFALLLLSPFAAGPVARLVANRVVPGITGTSFKVDKISVNPYTGRIFVGGFVLGNPAGFDDPVAVSVDVLSVDLSFASLFSKCIKIRDITIESPYVSFLYDAALSNNFARIAAHATANGKEAAKEKKAQEDSGDPLRFRIDRLCINGTKVNFCKLVIPVPVPTFTGLGATEEGATAQEICNEVWHSVQDSFSLLGSTLGGTSGKITKGASKFLKDLGAERTASAVSTVGDGTAQAAEALGKGAKRTTEALGQGTRKAAEALGNLFK